MRVPFILSRYLIRRFCITFLYLCLFLSVILFIFELIDATKMAYSALEALLVVSLTTVSKVYGMISYTSLGASVVTLYQMRQNKELTAYTHLGFAPKSAFLVFTFMVACYSAIDIFLLDPNINIIDFHTKQLEQKAETAIEVSSSGVWLRDTDKHEYRYMHAETVLPKENTFKNVHMLILNPNGQLNSYWTIEKAVLSQNQWHFFNATNLEAQNFSEMFKTTILTPSDLKVFAQHKFLPFMKIPKQIHLFKKLNLATDYYRVLWHKFLSQYLFSIALIMLGFIIATTLYNNVYMFMGTLFTGLALYFTSEIIVNYVIAYHVGMFYVVWILPCSLLFLIWRHL